MRCVSPPVLALLLLSAAGPALGEEITKTFTYTKTKQADLEIVVHFPPGWNESDKRPGIVFFFGGGWENGTIDAFEPQAQYFASRGMVTSPNPPGMTSTDVPCCRCDSASTVDHYEPRQPHLLEDGFPVPRWHSSDHRRPNGEISYDLVMEEDMRFVEGSYRIGRGEWHVLLFSRRPIAAPLWNTGTWDGGISGIVVHVPLTMRQNAMTLENLLAEILGVGAWERVQGPDSIQLR